MESYYLQNLDGYRADLNLSSKLQSASTSVDNPHFGNSKAEKCRGTKQDLKLHNRFSIIEEDFVEDNVLYSEDGKEESLENTKQVPKKKKSFTKKQERKTLYRGADIGFD